MDASVVVEGTAVRRRIEVRGIVQGVGFRPFVYRLASEMALSGWVRNDARGVTIEAQGDAPQLERLAQRVRAEAPVRSRIDSVAVSACPPVADAGGFAILDSGGGAAATAIGPDSAVCDDCLAELFDPADRRYRYAFVNCTNCGPRYTITRGLPYDRALTSMAGFAQCPDCLAEYRAPADRRFHAEPNACPACGPSLALLDAAGQPVTGVDPVAETARRLARGEIVAIKGLGGFHLACDARNEDAVARLRARKNREQKPFALLVANAASVAPWAEIGAAERAALASPERPIVLLKKRAAADHALRGVAPGLAWLGAMLPCTPLQYLLFHEAAGRPAGRGWLDAAQPLVLVMTSANPGGEPLVTGNDEALARLAGIADAHLVHDRDIVTRCDDSVVRAGRGETFQFVRRARGYTPCAVRLAAAGPPIVAVGGHFKNTVCVTRGDEAFVSQHIGELDNAPTCAAQDEAIDHLVAILDVQPALVAHDLHPDYYSTRLAARLAARWGVPALGVQHHHAHVAAVVAEHRIAGPVIGLALDGVGLGSDGAAWGGELLRVDAAGFERLDHLAPIPLPGGDAAAREPWRVAAAVLHGLGRGDEIERRYGHRPAAAAVHQMLDRGLRCPPTTSAGRWFDAAAALLGAGETSAYEGQAPMQLEALAARGMAALPPNAGQGLVTLLPDGTLDPLPLLARLADEKHAATGAALFHQALADGLARWVAQAAERTGLRTVALGGGCFLNAVLGELLVPRLAALGLRVLQARQAPPNDGGLALGQAWVALQQLQTPQTRLQLRPTPTLGD